MSKLQQDFLHPLFYFIHKNNLSTYGTTATQSDALPHNTTRQDWDRTEMRPPNAPPYQCPHTGNLYKLIHRFAYHFISITHPF